MTAPTGLLAALTAVLMLTTGCGTGHVGAAAPSATPSASEVSSGTPLTMIPPDVRLPHEGTWKRAGRSPTPPLPGECLDPGPALTFPEMTDDRAVMLTEHRGSRSEALGIYADRRRATRTIVVWRRQIEECGGPLDHVGRPIEYVVERVTIRGADEAWRSYVLSGVAGARGTSQVYGSTTVARVGSAVYVERVQALGRLDDAAVAARSRREVASVAAYVPTLAVFAS